MSREKISIEDYLIQTNALIQRKEEELDEMYNTIEQFKIDNSTNYVCCYIDDGVINYELLEKKTMGFRIK